MYGMTTLVPSINFPVDGFGFLLRFDLLKELLDSGCFVGFCEGDPFVLQEIKVYGMGLWITDNFAEMGWLEF